MGEVKCGESLHLSCKRDQIKMIDYMGSRVTPQKGITSPTGVPHLHVNRPYDSRRKPTESGVPYLFE